MAEKAGPHSPPRGALVLQARLVVGERRGSYPYSNSVLVDLRGLRVLVDAGAGEHLAQLDPDVVVVSHLHPDHVRFIKLFAGRRILVPAYDAAYSRLEVLAKRFAGPVWREWAEMARSYGVPEEIPYTGVYEDGDKLCHNGACIDFTVLRGHLRSHHAVILPQGGVYGADVDLTPFGPWYGNPEAGLQAFLDDIVYVAELRPTTYYSAHHPEPVPRERLSSLLEAYASKPYQHMRSLLEELGRRGVARPSDLAGAGIVYPRGARRTKRYPGVFAFFEKNMLEELASHLRSLGCLARTPRGYRVLGAPESCAERLGAEEERLKTLVRDALS